LTRTKSYRAAVGVAKRMLVPPAVPVETDVEQPPVTRHRNPC
jgi:hypothetical protein